MILMEYLQRAGQLAQLEVDSPPGLSDDIRLWALVNDGPAGVTASSSVLQDVTVTTSRIVPISARRRSTAGG